MDLLKEPTNASRYFSPASSRGRRWDHFELLERIDACGSISGAAAAMGMSYKAAWHAVENMNNLSEHPLVERQTGGHNGGGTRLTTYGRRAVAAWRRIGQEHEKMLAAFGQSMGDFNQYYQFMRRFDLKTSARNQFLGHVIAIKNGQVNAEVTLDIGGGDQLIAVITHDSVEHLGLESGIEVCALIKAPWVIVTTDVTMRTSARNRLCGTVVRCQEGAVNAEVVIELPGGKLVVATVTNESVRELGLEAGTRACALIKASHIILAVPV